MPLVAVADEGYRFDELTGDARTVGETNSAIALNRDYSMTASFVNQCS